MNTSRASTNLLPIKRKPSRTTAVPPFNISRLVQIFYQNRVMVGTIPLNYLAQEKFGSSDMIDRIFFSNLDGNHIHSLPWEPKKVSESDPYIIDIHDWKDPYTYDKANFQEFDTLREQLHAPSNLKLPQPRVLLLESGIYERSGNRHVTVCTL